MKISNSKKELARIIRENGGWSGEAGWAVQHANGRVVATAPHDRPEFGVGTRWWNAGWFYAGFDAKLQPNWHQTILSRDEYFHLYPALGELCGKVTEENRHEPVWTNPPSIEQLAADYQNAKDYADRKQQEADAAKADAEAKLAELVAAGKALGLVVRVAGVEPERVITDWRDLQLGDVIKAVPFNDERDTKFRGGWADMNLGKEFAVFSLSENGIGIDSSNPLNPQEETDRGLAFSFIRRPSKAAPHA